MSTILVAFFAVLFLQSDFGVVADRGACRRTGADDRQLAVCRDHDDDRPAVVQGAAGNSGIDQVEVRGHGARAVDRGVCGRTGGRSRQQQPLPGVQGLGHHGRAGAVLEAEHVADLMQQNGEQVDTAVGRAGCVCCGAEIGAEFGVLCRGRIDEPAASGGAGIKGDRVAIGEAELAARQVADYDVEIRKAGVGI